ncbi:YeiH family protein [Amaricoccus macauensis]|uniref:YeiH family protein n=1 Tax=Amaricoccus macauensis TaxID=57001 RepID=UPI003C7D0535
MSEAPADLLSRLRIQCADLAPGILVSAVIALAARFLSEHYGAPTMLMALLLGIAFHFLAEEGRCVQGIDFTARWVLRFGVALLGARISLDLLLGLGIELIALIISGVVATILIGLGGARLLGLRLGFGMLTGGSVAICGASAALAISAALPDRAKSEQTLIFTVLSVTVLGTFAMIFYPILAEVFGLDSLATGLFLGGTIHDVAQVVGAGFSVSEDTGEVATLVKLIRVAMLAPVVLALSIVARGRFTDEGDSSAKRPPLIPGFVAAFIILAGLNSAGLIPQALSTGMTDLSGWALVMAIAAVGMKTSLKSIGGVGGTAMALIAGESLFLATWVLTGIWLLDA